MGLEITASFTGSIAADVLAVAAVAQGSISPGDEVLGVGVLSGQTVLAQIDGTPGGVGTYKLLFPNDVSPAQPMMTARLDQPPAGASNGVFPTQLQVQSALRLFLLTLLPSGQCAFNGRIAGTVLTVGQVVRGAPIVKGDRILGQWAAPGTVVSSQIDGEEGGAGTYEVSPSQNTDGDTGSQLTPMSTGVDVVEFQDNRVATPWSPDYVVMSVLGRRRLSTNQDAANDCRYVGGIADDVLTVTSVDFGEIQYGLPVFGVGVQEGTRVTGALTGRGGVGTYRVAPGAQSVSSRILASGTKALRQATEFEVQLDVHGPNSGDNAQAISTAMRDSWATEQFANQRPNYLVSPLHADDPRQAPFQNEAQQYEMRWVVRALLQADPVLQLPQQYFDSATVSAREVDAAFPPT